jgi:hypothetical protein
VVAKQLVQDSWIEECNVLIVEELQQVEKEKNLLDTEDMEVEKSKEKRNELERCQRNIQRW